MSSPEMVASARSADGSTKYLIQYDDGATVEALIMPRRSQQGTPRTSLCLSSQVGCSRRCLFCATGRLGLRRSLGTEEILGQFDLLAREAKRQELPAPSNVLFMGMGEPLDNYQAVHGAVVALTDHRSYDIPLRKMTVSTTAAPGSLDRYLSRKPYPGLAVSLVSAQARVRSQLVPHGLSPGELKQQLQDVQRRVHKRLILEVILFEGLNTNDEEIEALVAWLTEPPRLKVLVNLIPWNELPHEAAQSDRPSSGRRFATGALPVFHAPTVETVQEFSQHLLKQGIPTTIRRSAGADVAGGCGQLAGIPR